MKRCCLERKTSMDLLFKIANLYDGKDFSTLSEKESEILILLVDNGLGKVYNVYDVDGTTLMKYYTLKRY